MHTFTIYILMRSHKIFDPVPQNQTQIVPKQTKGDRIYKKKLITLKRYQWSAFHLYRGRQELN